MKPLLGPCEHCGLNPKSDWLSRCRYAETLRPEIREGWKQSGADAPCASDAYDALQDELRSSAFRHIAVTIVMLVGFVLATWLMLG